MKQAWVCGGLIVGLVCVAAGVGIADDGSDYRRAIADEVQVCMERVKTLCGN